jgi:hypothetical protein
MAKRNDTSSSTTNLASKTLAIIHPNIIPPTYINRLGQIYVHMNNSPTLLPRAMKPSTCQECAEILGDPYSKNCPLPSIGNYPCLADSPKLSSYRVPGQSQIQQRHTTCYNHPRIDIRSAKRDDSYGASNIVLPCPGVVRSFFNL